jgi:hypothetical protein
MSKESVMFEKVYGYTGSETSNGIALACALELIKSAVSTSNGDAKVLDEYLDALPTYVEKIKAEIDKAED